MNAVAWVLLAVAAVAAVADWTAVARRLKPLEFAAKPATLAALVGVAASLTPAHSGQRAWFVVALVLCLVGDVFLMLPNERFVPGLVAFLLAHLAYAAGFAAAGGSGAGLAVATLAVAVVSSVVGREILRGVRRRQPDLGVPVTGYMVVISVMVALAAAWGGPLAAAGAGLFYVSDALIAWNRFVRPLAWAPLAIIVTYHTGQTALVLSLL